MAYVYHAPTLTVDIVIFQLIGNVLHVLLVQRANEPFEGEWALPGVYNAAGDTTLEALEKRVLQAKIGLSLSDLAYVEQLYAFDAVGRDPRGHVISIAYLGLGYDLNLKSLSATQSPTFFPAAQLWDLAFDHEDIVPYARERLRRMVSLTTAARAMLSPVFTLSQL